MSIPLDYLVIIDLEATSDDPTDPNRAEIVEFPFAVYSLSTHSLHDHKQIYIKPRWNTNPNPPPDVVRNLGTDVAFTNSLADALLQFDAYVYQSFIISSKSFYVVFDGHWDLTCLLFGEAARKALVLAPYFRSYINLRHEFSRCYPSAPVPTDRKTMFAYLQIPTEPRASGLDECVALGNLITRMLADGHRFTQPEIISDYDWATLPSRIPAIATSVANAVPVGGIIRLRGLPWTSTETDVETFLAGIPIVPSGVHFVRTPQGKATGEAFVQLESADGVAMALARDKQSVGRRYIEVFKSSPVDMANHLGRADARRHMYAHGKGRASGVKNKRKEPHAPVSPGASMSYVVRISGLPKTAVADDLLPLFNGLETIGDGIHIIRIDGECTGEAFVELVSEAWGKKALMVSGASVTCAGSGGPTPVEIRKSSHAQMRGALAGEAKDGQRGKKNGSPDTKFYLRIHGIGDDVTTQRIIDMFDKFRVREEDITIRQDRRERVARVSFSSREARDMALSEGATFEEVNNMVIEDGGNGNGRRREQVMSPCVVRMRGLPFTSNEEDIVQFFEGYTIAPGGIARGKDRHGRASGEAWVTFVSSDDAKEVVDKLDKAHMGNRYIELKF